MQAPTMCTSTRTHARTPSHTCTHTHRDEAKSLVTLDNQGKELRRQGLAFTLLSLVCAESFSISDLMAVAIMGGRSVCLLGLNPFS